MDIYKLKEFNPKYRAIEAARNIKEGELIMKCHPIAHAVISSMRTKICSFCLKEQEEQLRCSQCKVMFYCNKQCQQKDWSFHKLQCKHYEAISNKKFKITSEFILLARCYLVSEKDKEVDEQISRFLELSEVQPEEIRQYYVEMATVFLENFGIPRETETMAKLIKLCGIISINTFTIQDYLFNHAGIAIGLYFPANYINHSCNPNSVQIFNGKQLNIVSLRAIEEEEQITISYIDETLDIKERKNILRQSYYFECLCFQCLAQKAVQRDLSDLLCDKCEEGSLMRTEQGEYSCNKCKAMFPAEKVKSKRQEIERLKSVLEKEAPYQESIKSFYALRKLLKFTNPFFAKVIQNLYHQALEQAQLKQSDRYYSDGYQLMKSYLYNFPQWYHMTSEQKFHILLLWKYAEMSKLSMYLGKLKKAMQYTQKAMGILEKSRLSSDFEEVQNLKKRSEQLQLQCKMNATSCRR